MNNEQSRSYEAPDEDKPLLPDWVCQECGGGLDPKVCYWDGDKRVCADCWGRPEPSPTRDMLTHFVHDGESLAFYGFEADAKRAAEEAMNVWRNVASDDGEWPEEVQRVCWGEIKQMARAGVWNLDSGEVVYTYELEPAGSPKKVLLDNAVSLASVSDKQIPVIHWPDGSYIYVMPHKIEDGQDPAEQLRRWLAAWVEQCTEELKEPAAFGHQCYQDQCEGAYVETSVHKRVVAERDEANQRAERAEKKLKDLQAKCIETGWFDKPKEA